MNNDAGDEDDSTGEGGEHAVGTDGVDDKELEIDENGGDEEAGSAEEEEKLGFELRKKMGFKEGKSGEDKDGGIEKETQSSGRERTDLGILAVKDLSTIKGNGQSNQFAGRQIGLVVFPGEVGGITDADEAEKNDDDEPGASRHGW